MPGKNNRMLIDLVRNNYGEMDKVAQWVEMLATKAQKPELDPQTPQQKEGTDLWKGVVWPSLRVHGMHAPSTQTRCWPSDPSWVFPPMN